MTSITRSDDTVDPKTAHLTEQERRRLLTARRRRIALAVLADSDDNPGLRGLAERVANRESAVTGQPVDADAVALELHHVHLPKLSDYDVVPYDPAKRCVETH